MATSAGARVQARPPPHHTQYLGYRCVLARARLRPRGSLPPLRGGTRPARQVPAPAWPLAPRAAAAQGVRPVQRRIRPPQAPFSPLGAAHRARERCLHARYVRFPRPPGRLRQMWPGSWQLPPRSACRAPPDRAHALSTGQVHTPPRRACGRLERGPRPPRSGQRSRPARPASSQKQPLSATAEHRGDGAAQRVGDEWSPQAPSRQMSARDALTQWWGRAKTAESSSFRWYSFGVASARAAGASRTHALACVPCHT